MTTVIYVSGVVNEVRDGMPGCKQGDISFHLIPFDLFRLVSLISAGLEDR